MKSTILSQVFILMFATSIFGKFDSEAFFNNTNTLLQQHVQDGKIDYASLTSNAQFKSLISQIETIDLGELEGETKKAFLINAYNLQVINKVLKNYPLKSVLDKSGFFDTDKILFAGKKMTLNKLEKDYLLKPYNDARLHFVLVCGAVGCPPITDFAYNPSLLESQLEQQTRKALNDPTFIQINDGKVELSEIFKWYKSDFGGSNASVITFINKYRNQPINTTKYSYYRYDWKINDSAAKIGAVENNGSNGSITVPSNESRYIVSSTIPKGSVELKIFNNLYSEQTSVNEQGELQNRSSFFTTSVSALYGLTDRFNIGINSRFRRVRNNPLPSSPFSVFGSDSEQNSRTGLTAIGPQIRYAPIPKWTNFSIQSSFVFPIGEDLAGNANRPYIDWNGATWITQFFNDFSIGDKFSLFTELDFWWEDIGSSENNHANRLATPVTAIFSYVPNQKLVLYTLAGYAPFWQSEFDYFRQFGVGAKYQFTPNIELELLYTDFSNKFLAESSGQAETINLGLRFNL